MFVTPAQIAELQKGQIDTCTRFRTLSSAPPEKFADLNIAAAKALLEESSESTQSYLGRQGCEGTDVVERRFRATRRSKKLVSYNRNLYSIASAAGAEIAKIVEVRIAESNRKVAEMVDFAAKNAPAGSEAAVSLIKNVVAASNTAYDTFSKAAKQAVSVCRVEYRRRDPSSLNAGNVTTEAVP